MPRDNTIIAAFRSSAEAQAAATDLQNAGIPRNDIYLELAGNQTDTTRSESREGGLVGWFKSAFGMEDHPDRTRYESAIQSGNTLLRVDADESQIDTIENVLNRHSPIDISADSDVGTTAATGTRASAGAGASTEAQGSIPVVQEELQVGKRQVQRGALRVYSRVVEQPIEESVRLREERLRVERRPTDRAATEADLRAGQEKVIEVQEFAEEPVVAKQARVVEEVSVGKDVSERTETVRDTIRRTEVDVQNAEGGTGTSFDDTDFRSDFQSRYGSAGSYETYAPAYRYGYEMASDARYRGRSFEEVEPELRTDYSNRYPNSTWEKMKDAIRYSWDKVTGKTRAATR